MSGAGQMPGRAVARVVWASLLAALVVYWVVLAALSPSADAASADTVLPVLLFFGAVQSVVVIVLRRRLAPALAAWPTEPAEATRAFTQAVVCWALAEGVALYGLVLGILGAEGGETTAFFLAGALLLLLTRPRG